MRNSIVFLGELLRPARYELFILEDAVRRDCHLKRTCVCCLRFASVYLLFLMCLMLPLQYGCSMPCAHGLDNGDECMSHAATVGRREDFGSNCFDWRGS